MTSHCSRTPPSQTLTSPQSTYPADNSFNSSTLSLSADSLDSWTVEADLDTASDEILDLDSAP